MLEYCCKDNDCWQ